MPNTNSLVGDTEAGLSDWDAINAPPPLPESFITSLAPSIRRCLELSFEEDDPEEKYRKIGVQGILEEGLLGIYREDYAPSNALPPISFCYAPNSSMKGGEN